MKEAMVGQIVVLFKRKILPVNMKINKSQVLA